MMSRARNIAVAAAGVLLSLHFATRVLAPAFAPGEGRMVNDFGSYYAASRMIAAGDDPYRTGDRHHTMELRGEEAASWSMNNRTVAAYIYPPFLAAALIPLTSIDFPAARLAWCVALSVCFAGCIWLTFTLIGRRPGADLVTLLVLVVYAGSMPTLENFHLGQVNYPVLFLILLAFHWHRRGRPVAGGVALAVASLIKVSPVLLLPYFLWKRDYRFTAGFAAAAVVATACTMAAFPSLDAAFLGKVLPEIGGRAAELNNKAPAVWWKFLFLENASAPPLAPLPWLATLLSAATSAAVVAGIALLLRRRRGAPTRRGAEGAQFAVCCAGLLLAQPYLQIHHLIFAFPAAAVAADALLARRARPLHWALFIVALAALNSRGENAFRWIGAHWYAAFLTNPQAYGLALLVAILVMIPEGSPRSGPAATARE